MGGRRAGRPSAGGRIAAAALSALLALGGATAALADEAIVVEREGIEETTAGGQGEAGSAAAQSEPQEEAALEPQADGTAVTADDTKWTTGTYTVTGDVTSSNRVVCEGNVVLVLNKGCTLTMPKGITVSADNTLTIQGSGALVADVSDYSGGGLPAIGGGRTNLDAGTVNITGGTVTAIGSFGGAGIGSATSESFIGGKGGIVNITGGTVTAEGGQLAAGIGGGIGGDGGSVTIKGGTVKAKGESAGAGIGGGVYGAGGRVEISGGNVTATGGTVTSEDGVTGGAGIGGGSDASGGEVKVTGGTVTATGGKLAAGIGGGGFSAESYGDGGTVTITGGTVTAKGGLIAAGIGSGAYSSSAGTVTITGGTITATGGDYDEKLWMDFGSLCGGAGIGAGGLYYAGDADEGPAGTVGGTVTIGGGAVVRAVGGEDTYAKVYDVTDGIGVGAAAKKEASTWTATLEIGSGRVLYGSASDIAMDVNDEDCLRSGEVASYAGDRYQYMVVNGNKVAAPALSYATKSLTKAAGDAAFTNPLTNGSGAAVAYESSDTSVATVDSAGKVTIKGTGTTTITATYAGDGTHEGASASYELTVESGAKPAVTLKFKKSKVTKTYGAKPFTNRLANESGVKVAYESSNEKVAKVNKATGKVTIKGLGTATITAAFAGDDDHEAASASYRVVVRLAKTQGLKTVCHPSARTVDVSWNKVKGAKKYLVQWRVRGGKWRTEATEGTSLTIKGMRAKRYYEVRVRAVSGKRKGAWSATSRRWYVPAAGVSAKASKEKGKVKVSWSRTKGANKGYLVLVRYSKDGPIVARERVGKGKTSATISGLRSGKSAWVSVRPLRRAYGRTWVGVLTPIAGVEVR